MQVIKICEYGEACNSYILTSGGNEAVLVDCGGEFLYDEFKKRNLKPVAVLLTHGHFDHVGGCGKFYREGVPVYCGAGEEELIFSAENRNIFGGVYIPDFKISGTFKDGEEKTFGGMKFKIISTPGHTAGGVSYLTESGIFTGDTLFYRSVGRCDLPTGDMETLLKSVNKILSLSGDVPVFCGHGLNTSIEAEREHNPFIKRC